MLGISSMGSSGGCGSRRHRSRVRGLGHGRGYYRSRSKGSKVDGIGTGPGIRVGYKDNLGGGVGDGSEIGGVKVVRR